LYLFFIIISTCYKNLEQSTELTCKFKTQITWKISSLFTAKFLEFVEFCWRVSTGNSNKKSDAFWLDFNTNKNILEIIF